MSPAWLPVQELAFRSPERDVLYWIIYKHLSKLFGGQSQVRHHCPAVQTIALPSSKAAPALPTVLTYAASMVSQSFEDKRNHFMAELRTYDRQPGRQHRYIPSVIKLVYHSLPEPGVSGLQCCIAE